MMTEGKFGSEGGLRSVDDAPSDQEFSPRGQPKKTHTPSAGQHE